jgi:Xaa-Pro aminopeptidase
MRELMDREGLDALAFTSTTYIKFATNFAVDESWSERPEMCVIPRNGPPFLILHEISTNHWRYAVDSGRLWAADASFYAEHPRVRQRLPLVSQWSELLTARLEQAGLQSSRIGTDGADFPRVAQRLPRVQFANVGRQCERLRWIKHDEEISVMREAASLADWMQERYRENIRPGRLVAELDSSMRAMMIEEATRRMPGAEMTFDMGTLSGPASAAPNSAAHVGSRIEKGHVLVNIIAPAIDGLYIESERTWFCGEPTSRQVQLYEAARAANAAGAEAAVVGKPIWAIDAAAQDVFERAGLADLVFHRTGHGLGLGGHDFPIDMPFNDSPLQENMVFSVEPGVYEFGLGGFRLDDTVVVGKRPQILTSTSRDLQSQTIS